MAFFRILTLSLAVILAVALDGSPILRAQTPSSQTPSSTTGGVYTVVQAKRGDPLYQTQCASCHGSDLSGNGQAPPLSGDDFVANWQGQSLGDLFDKIQTTMPADNPASLKRPQTADILAYILSVDKFPAGQAELPVDPALLKQIRIEKPSPAAPAKGQN